jgi:ABC-type lipoprotein release transport system permease subunit
MKIPLRYNARSLLLRPVSTLMTVLSIALVVTISVAILALADGLDRALVSSGGPENVLVRRRGSDSELSSSVSREALQAIQYVPGVKTDAQGGAVASGEVVVVVNLPRRNQEQGANVTVRGLSAAGMALHPQVRLVEGRMFQPGLREVVVSRSIAERFQRTSLGDRLHLGKGEWEVVGIFDAGQTAFGSEIWADVNQLAGDFNRQTYSSVLLRAADAASLGSVIERIESDRRFNLMAQREVEYYEEQTRASRPLKLLATFIAVVMGIGACFAAMNTMSAAVAYRAREITTLRVLGFRQRSVLLSFLFESLLLALAGGVIGCLLVWPINGLTTGTVNWQTFSEVAFAFRITPWLLLKGLAFAAALGLLGGMLPAWQASRLTPAGTLREL